MAVLLSRATGCFEPNFKLFTSNDVLGVLFQPTVQGSTDASVNQWEETMAHRESVRSNAQHKSQTPPRPISGSYYTTTMGFKRSVRRIAQFGLMLTATSQGFVSSPAVPVRAQAFALQSTKLPHEARLTATEESKYLSQAVEWRRLKELAYMAPSKSTLQRAREAGYETTLAYESAWTAGQTARDTLVTRNMGLVHFCVKDIIGNRSLQTLSKEDLIQEGSIGLARAVDKWNPDVGGRFSTYAVYWIRALVLRCIAERDEIVRVPEHVSGAVRKLSKAAQQIGLSSYAQDQSWKEAKAAKALAEQAGLSDRQVTEALKVKERRSKGMLSFESWMQQGRDLSTDLATSVSSEPVIETEYLKSTLSQFLRPREIEAISWRYGLNRQEQSLSTGRSSGEAMTFAEVGAQMKVSAEYGRRLCHAALTKLQRAASEGQLELGLLM